MNHYDLLGVKPKATREEIRGAYLRLAQAFHPDRHVGEKQSEADRERFKQIHEAYEVLYDDAKRVEYDRQFGAIPQPRQRPASPDERRASATQKQQSTTSAATVRRDVPDDWVRRASAPGLSPKKLATRLAVFTAALLLIVIAVPQCRERFTEEISNTIPPVIIEMEVPAEKIVGAESPTGSDTLSLVEDVVAETNEDGSVQRIEILRDKEETLPSKDSFAELDAAGSPATPRKYQPTSLADAALAEDPQFLSLDPIVTPLPPEFSTTGSYDDTNKPNFPEFIAGSSEAFPSGSFEGMSGSGKATIPIGSSASFGSSFTNKLPSNRIKATPRLPTVALPTAPGLPRAGTGLPQIPNYIPSPGPTPPPYRPQRPTTGISGTGIPSAFNLMPSPLTLRSSLPTQPVTSGYGQLPTGPVQAGLSGWNATIGGQQTAQPGNPSMGLGLEAYSNPYPGAADSQETIGSGYPY